jgi:hypothetical protein
MGCPVNAGIISVITTSILGAQISQSVQRLGYGLDGWMSGFEPGTGKIMFSS